MENRINIAELLRDCPEGMELNCTMYDNLVFCEIDSEAQDYPIITQLPNGVQKWFSSDGRYELNPNAKCVIFPKGKTTWEGFVPPCKFKDGDVIFTHTNASKGLLENYWVSIFKEYRNNRCACYACLCLSDLELYHDKWEDELLCELCEIEKSRLATEEEKAKLFQAIKDNGYKWNSETKTLEKLVESKEDTDDRIVMSGIYFDRENYADEVELHLNNYEIEIRDGKTYAVFKNQETKTLKPKFKVDDKIKLKGEDEFGIITQVSDCFYIIKCKNNIYYWSIKKQDDLELINEPKFKVGDRVRSVIYSSYYTIVDIKNGQYFMKSDIGIYARKVPFRDETDYMLIPDKFDIATLKPFDKVLVRDTKEQVWVADLFSHMVNRPLGGYTFACVGHYPNQCIPYEGNEHLLGKTDDCDNYYKTWEK